MISGFVSSTAGGGSTTLLLAVAARLASRGKRVVLIDADPLGELSQRLQRRPSRPLDDLFSWSEAKAKESKGIEIQTNVTLFAVDSGRFVGAGVALSQGVLAALAQSQRERADVVLVDLPPLGAPAMVSGLHVVDHIVACAPLHMAGVRALPQLLRLILGAKKNDSPAPQLMGVVGGLRRDEPSSLALDRELELSCGSMYVAVPFDPRIEQATRDGSWVDPGTTGALAPAVSRLATALASTPSKKAQGVRATSAASPQPHTATAR